MRILLVALVSLFVCFFPFFSSAEEKLAVAGSGSMIPLVTELAKAFMAEKTNVVIDVNQKSIESTGGIMSAANGTIDIGMSARPLKDSEKSLGVVLIEIARVATVLGVNKSVPLREISAENLCKIYEGKIANWSQLGGGEGKILALTRPDRDATKNTVRDNISCFSNLKEADSIVVIPTSPEMVNVLSNRENTVGFTDSVAIDRSEGAIVALDLDGIPPSAENVKTGKYKVIKTNYLVAKGTPAGTAREFIDFIKSDKGSRIIEANKAVAVQ